LLTDSILQNVSYSVCITNPYCPVISTEKHKLRNTIYYSPSTLTFFYSPEYRSACPKTCKSHFKGKNKKVTAIVLINWLH